VQWRDVWQRRLVRHFLTEPAAFVDDVVDAVCGIHAQIQSCAEISLGLRVTGLTQAAVRTALWQERTLVRTYGLRNTIHIFSARELPMWLSALRTRTPSRGQRSITGLDAMVDAIADALDGQCLTRAELAQALEQRLGRAQATRTFAAFAGELPIWHHALAPAAHAGLLAFGPPRGNQVTYERLPRLPEVDGEEALREVARRFLLAYGPATHVEFARWFLMHPPAARTLFDSMRGELEEVDVEGWRAWEVAGEKPAEISAERTVHLVPQFDCYVVGSHPRAQLMPESVPELLRQMGTAGPWAVLLIDGIVAGLWAREKRGKQLHIRIGAFAELRGRDREEATRQAERIGQILQARTEVEFGYVEPRAHL